MISGPTESAIIVAMPAAEAAIAPWRAQLDPSAAWGVPAHVTVLYPFLPPERIDAAVLDVVADAVRTVPRFDVALTSVQWFDDGVVWLAPEPAEPFRALTGALWDRFPETPPYGGAYPELVPHLTIGEGGSDADMRAAAAAVVLHLPVRTAVEAVRVMCGSREPRTWHTVAEISLGQ